MEFKKKMKRILFITNRNILTTCGELRLIKNRAEVLYEKYNIATDFIAWNSIDRIKSKKREEIHAGGSIDTIELCMMNPFQVINSYRTLKKLIIKKMRLINYCGVIVSGTLMPSLIMWLKKEFSIKVYIDIHGAFEDILEVAKKSKITKRILFYLLFKLDKSVTLKGIQNSDGVFVVTKALKDYLQELNKTKKHINYFIVPCAPETQLITKEEYEIDRKKYREKYGISPNTLVFIYSGGVSSWQCVEESIELYLNIAKSLCRPTKMLIFSHSVDAVRSLVNDDEKSVIIDSYSPNELVHALRAGDFAFLLRKNSKTNNVAFPNKFLEYVQSGMRIITTPYVYEIARQVKKFDIGYIWNFNGEISDLDTYIKETATNDNRYKIFETILAFNSFSITLKMFVEKLISD